MDVARDNILGRVRVALHTQAQQPLAPTNSPVFPTVTNPETHFREEFAALRGEIIESSEALKSFLKEFGKIATDGSNPVNQVIGVANADVKNCDLGVTGCDCLVAQTGSIIVSAISAGGRALSV